MGTFDSLRRFVTGDRAGDHPYVCRGCGRRFAREHHVCPDCNGFRVERTEWESPR